jgi:hypothetical protein
MDIVDAAETVIGHAPAPIAVVSDNGPCFRGQTFQTAFDGDDPLLRHMRTRIKSPQTNGVVWDPVDAAGRVRLVSRRF